jgi:hypothetical protein
MRHVDARQRVIGQQQHDIPWQTLFKPPAQTQGRRRTPVPTGVDDMLRGEVGC